MKIYDLIIIGGGPAGITAGIYAGRQKMDTLLLAKELGGGKITSKAVNICNFPGFEKISGIELLERFVKHLKTQQIETKTAEIFKIEKDKDIFTVISSKKEKFFSKTVIIATGSDPRSLGAKGEKEFVGKGVGYCVTCLLPKEEIVANSSIREIDKIGISERVLTIDGSYQNINQIMSHDYDGEMVEIKTRFFTEPVKITADHLVLTGERDENDYNFKINISNKQEWKRAGDLKTGDLVLYPIITKTEDIKEIKFSEILGTEVVDGFAKNNQETYTSHRLNDIIKVDEDFLRLAGYYISEGALGVHHVNFYFNKKEKEYIKDVQELVKKVFGLSSIAKIENSVVRIIVSCKLIRDLFQILFGKNAPNKKIPHWAMFLPFNKQVNLIKGIFRGDGCMKDKSFELDSVSKILIYQLRDSLLRFQVISGIDRRAKEKLNKTPGEVGGRKIRFNYDRYHIRVGGPSLEKMSNILGVCHPKIKNRKFSNNHAWIKDNYLYLPIKEIKKEKYKGKVYSLLVENNNTFTTKSFIVHNCDGPLFKNKSVAIAGGGNSGFEAAEFMERYADKIYILEYGSEVKADLENQELVKKIKKIEVITNAQIKEIKGDKFVNSIVYEDLKEKKLKTLEVQGLFIQIGYQPATALAKGLVDFNERDEIKVEFETFQTKTPGLFAVGDVNTGPFKQIVTAAGEGCKAALAAYGYLQSLKNR